MMGRKVSNSFSQFFAEKFGDLKLNKMGTIANGLEIHFYTEL